MSLAQSAAAQSPGLVSPSATRGPSEPAMAIAPSMAAAAGAGIRASTGRANAAATPTAVPVTMPASGPSPARRLSCSSPWPGTCVPALAASCSTACDGVPLDGRARMAMSR